jgi:hypothetical protein
MNQRAPETKTVSDVGIVLAENLCIEPAVFYDERTRRKIAVLFGGNGSLKIEKNCRKRNQKNRQK